MEHTPSDTSSELSSPPLTPLSRSPSPVMFSYPTPPSSQLSDKGANTPRSEEDTITLNSSDRDGPPPKKRRKTDDTTISTTGSKMPRETKRLDFEKMRRDSTLESSVQMDRLLKALCKKRKIVVVAGAGISVSAGIPDFRSSTGLFKSLKETHNLKGSGKQLFDAGVYRDLNTTSTFHTMVREMSSMSTAAEPTEFHHLIARLAHEGRLLRLYTQNVDGLENKLEPTRTQVPLPTRGPWPKSVQLHGGLEKMICSKCSKTSDFNADLFEQELPPECAECKALDITRTEVAGKRSHGVGRLRPRMTLYNETGPDDDAIGACSSADLKTRPDCILVVGTTLSVPGVRRIVREMCGIVRDRKDGLSVWINPEQEPAGKDLENAWDLVVTGKADELAIKAALGHWDDPVVVEAVKEEEITKSQIEVKVPSPTKPSSYYDAVRDEMRPVTPPELSVKVETQASMEATISSAQNPASKGKKLAEVLGKDRTACGKNTKKPAPKKKATTGASKTVAKGNAIKPMKTTGAKGTKKAAAKSNADIKITFKTSKAASAPVAKDKSSSSDTENMPSQGKKGSQKPTSKKRSAKQLDEVPDSDERVNSPSKPVKTVMFPGLVGKT